MKISKEELIELREQLNTQDPWGTSHPYWVIKDFTKCPTSSDYSDKYFWYCDDGEYTDEEMKEILEENNIKFTENNWEEQAEGIEYHKVFYREVESETQEIFLTSKEAKEYLERRKHAFTSKAYPYCKSGYYSREIQIARFVLSNLTDKMIEKLMEAQGKANIKGTKDENKKG